MTGLWIALGLGVAALAILVYWQLIIAEGAYLGPRVVAWTYDLVAKRYDAIKRFEPRHESWFVAGPLLAALADVERPLVLDVATGTGRLPLALLRERFRGQTVGLDLSLGMLQQAWRKLRSYGNQVTLLWQDASHLPFDDGTFDAVACMESLEFMPQPLEVLAEMVRVLAPGGTLLLTNRVGREARLLPGRAMPRPEFEQALVTQGLSAIEVRRWQTNYDLALARKPGPRVSRADGEIDLAALVHCPGCDGSLQRGGTGLSCPSCTRTYPVREGVVRLAEQGKGRQR